MIHAHGADVTVTSAAVTITRSDLAAALLGNKQRTVELSLIDDCVVREPTEIDMGYVQLAGSGEVIYFAPHQAEQARALAADIAAALRGDAPSAGEVSGLNFVALDVETANNAYGSICQVGVARFVDGQVAETQQWTCQPPAGLDEFAPDNVAVHGITAADVADSPRFAEIFPAVTEFIGEDPLVAHNAHFDTTALRDAAEASGIAGPTLLFGCSLALARSARLGAVNNRLPTLAELFGVTLKHHHEALSDAIAAGGIIAGLAARFGHRGSLMELFHSQGFTLGELADTKITPVLRDRSGAGRALQVQGAPSHEAVTAGAGTDFRDEQPSKSTAPWRAVATPDTIPDPNPAADEDGPLFGQNVVLTGDFEPFDKGRLWQGIAEQGGQVAKNVTKKATILVIGEWGAKTSKEKKADEYRAKGQEISYWTAQQLFDVLGLNEAPPF